jgi:NADH:ubiquinone oxidoreductase subunit 6 (subunit J)
MDSLHAVGFYVSSGISLAGGLGVALLPRRDQRGLALAALGVGLAGIYVTLSAGFAAVVALVCYAGAAALVASPQYRAREAAVSRTWRQLGAIAAALLLAVLAYSAFRGDFVQASFFGGPVGAANLGRLFFAHDALATEAVALLVLAAFAGATAVWRARERPR